MTTDTDLRAAVASILSMSPKSAPWTPKNFPFTLELNTALATICNAVASGDIVPRADVEGLVEALTPNGDTKAAYMGEIKDPETKRTVSWTAIKMIMAMILARAGIKEKHQ